MVVKYLAEIESTRKEKTHSAYRKALSYFFEVVGDKPLDKINRADLLDYRVYLRETMNQSPRSQWNKFSNVMGFLKKQGLKDLGVTSHDWPQYVEEEPEVYEQAVLRQFFEACCKEERLLFQFFLKTGFREQEVVYATKRCVDFENCTVSVAPNPEFNWTPKMYKGRTVPVPEDLIRQLRQMLVEREAGALLFPSREGKPQYHFLQMAKAIARRAGLPEDTVWLHKFRATFCTRCLRSGVDLSTVQMWMGHTDLASTMRYLKPQRGKEVREKVEAIWKN